MASWVTDIVLPLGTLLLGGAGGGLWAWASTRTTAKASVEVAEVKQASDLLPAIAAFQQGLNATAEAMLAGVREELAQVNARVRELEDENVQCRIENARLIASQDMLVAYLRTQGLAVPESALPHIITEFDTGVEVRIHDVAEPLKG